ncbi:MAG: recombination protein RecR [Lentisphaeria bacterium]|nr:recombination protein RecR [Lentisphaeria bacterium]MBQ9775777.1 recombination protein RecR [Lentisphaeria bacterium]
MAAHYPASVEELISVLKLLPGIGRRAAERLALAMLDWGQDQLQDFGKLIASLPETVGCCPQCGALSDAGELCAVCRQPDRDTGLLCVVENMAQLFAIENSGNYKGLYHILGGRLSPLNSQNGENLNISGLLAKADSGTLREIILALSPDVEGRATAIYLSELLEGKPVKVTRPALGLPAGANLSYADSATITAALNGRIMLSGGDK